MKTKAKKRLFGEEFIRAERLVFKRLPKKYHAEVHELIDRLGMWHIHVFLAVERERLKVKQ